MLMLILLCMAYVANISSIDAVIHDFYWRDYIYGDIPCDAYEGAPGRYIGQVDFNQHNLVGTIYTFTGNAIVEYGGIHSIKDSIKILCSPDHSKLYWEYVDFNKTNDQQLQNAIRGGFQEITRALLFIGKVIHEGEWKIGKVHNFDYGHQKGLWIWNHEQKSTNVHQLYILKYNITGVCQKQCNGYT